MVLMSSVHHEFLDTVHTSERKFGYYLFQLGIKVICDNLAKVFSSLIQIELIVLEICEFE